MKARRYLTLLWHIGRQMGWHYVLFRVGYWLQGKTGISKLRFPRKATSRVFIGVQKWRESKPKFLFDLQNLNLRRNAKLAGLEWRVKQIRSERFCYFSKEWFEMPGWHTNPLTGFAYPKYQHWSDVSDFSLNAGDIKYVWEKARFTFLYDLVRYDYHFEEDQSETVFRLISDWIESNPVNCGPNWKCSQEIALRVLNWTFALHYYRFSPTLNQPLSDKILCSIYDQMRHIAANIRFSEIAVSNNHVLTEALALFVAGIMFPCFPESHRWWKKGKGLFEREIISQIASDGTYLQFSTNYHRVVVQLLSWGIRLAELNEDHFGPELYDLAKTSLSFLRTCQNDENGRLPNYGHNDGALFFPLTECDFRDFRPQMAALARVLNIDLGYSKGSWQEESEWVAGRMTSRVLCIQMVPERLSGFLKGGYHIVRDAGTTTFLRCGSYYSRPYQADNNHLDIWVSGRNILRDAGTWSYNADEASMRYFSGTRSHNTIMIGDFDQMQKQQRFVWTHWITNAKGSSGSSDTEYWIEAEFEGFRHVGKSIIHKRRVAKSAGLLHWVVEDRVLNAPAGMCVRQLWHPDQAFLNDFRVNAVDACGQEIPVVIENGWYSEVYGTKVECKVLVFETFGGYIQTVIQDQ